MQREVSPAGQKKKTLLTCDSDMFKNKDTKHSYINLTPTLRINGFEGLGGFHGSGAVRGRLLGPRRASVSCSRAPFGLRSCWRQHPEETLYSGCSHLKPDQTGPLTWLRQSPWPVRPATIKHYEDQIPPSLL